MTRIILYYFETEQESCFWISLKEACILY